jgi:hypothetical protein
MLVAAAPVVAVLALTAGRGHASAPVPVEPRTIHVPTAAPPIPGPPAPTPPRSQAAHNRIAKSASFPTRIEGEP